MASPRSSAPSVAARFFKTFSRSSKKAKLEKYLSDNELKPISKNQLADIIHFYQEKKLNLGQVKEAFEILGQEKLITDQDLKTALKVNDIELFKLLVIAFPSAKKIMQCNQALMLQAVELQNEKLVAFLIDHGALQIGKSNLQAPLAVMQKAVELGNTTIVKLLLFDIPTAKLSVGNQMLFKINEENANKIDANVRLAIKQFIVKDGWISRLPPVHQYTYCMLSLRLGWKAEKLKALGHGYNDEILERGVRDYNNPHYLADIYNGKESQSVVEHKKENQEALRSRRSSTNYWLIDPEAVKQSQNNSPGLK